MPPRPKKAASATAPADLNGKRPANAKRSDLDALRAEVAAELPEGGLLHPVEFADITVLVKDFWDWPVEANELLARGFIVQWAQAVMPADEFAAWAKVKPTNRQAAEFMGAVEAVVGFPLGSWLTSLAS
jgi:hypothetical protein